LRQRIEAIIRQTLTRAFAPVDLVRDVREMRNKVAAEFPGRSPWDLKYAPGGLVDIEFAAQYLQLCHGRENPSILEPNTVRALEAIAAGGFVSGQQAPILIRSAKLQQSLIQVLRIAAEGAPDTDHATTGLKALLARAAGAANFTELEQLLAKCQSATHAAFNELIAT
jgi:glutamate-ammonia-ligase adenylyltransferase